jgi:hypothetical protein
LVGQCASIQNNRLERGRLASIDILPENTQAAQLRVLVMVGAVIVTVAEGGRFEFDDGTSDLARLSKLLAAVFAGRVTANTSPWQHGVTIDVAPGDQVVGSTVEWSASGILARVLRMKPRRRGRQEFEAYCTAKPPGPQSGVPPVPG